MSLKIFILEELKKIKFFIPYFHGLNLCADKEQKCMGKCDWIAAIAVEFAASTKDPILPEATFWIWFYCPHSQLPRAQPNHWPFPCLQSPSRFGTFVDFGTLDGRTFLLRATTSNLHQFHSSLIWAFTQEIRNFFQQKLQQKFK